MPGDTETTERAKLRGPGAHRDRGTWRCQALAGNSRTDAVGARNGARERGRIGAVVIVAHGTDGSGGRAGAKGEGDIQAAASLLIAVGVFDCQSQHRRATRDDWRRRNAHGR